MTDDTSPAVDLAALRELLTKASPLPWSLGSGQQDNLYGGQEWPQVWPVIGAPVADLNGRPGAREKDASDAALIVAAVNALPELLARLDDGLDAAWAEAEAALPEGWTLHGVRRGYVGAAATPNGPRWSATAQQAGLSNEIRRHGTVPNCSATGPTPAAALRSLAKALRERGEG